MGWGQICFDQIQCSKNLNSGEVSISHVFFTLGTRADSNVGKLVAICVLPILLEQKAERPISRQTHGWRPEGKDMVRGTRRKTDRHILQTSTL